MLHEVWENHLKYLKRGWNGKEGRENKDLKKGWQAESRGECLEKVFFWWGAGGAGTHLQTIIYLYIYIYVYIYNIYKFGNRFLYTVKNIA